MTDAQTGAQSDHATHIEATPASQGQKTGHIRWVLAISLVLVVVALFAAWGFHAHQLQAAQDRVRGQAPATDTAALTPKG